MILESLNESLFFFAQSFSSPALDWFFILVTTFGNPLLWMAASSVLFWKGEEKQSFFLMNTVVASAMLAGFFKAVFKQPRPQEVFLTARSVSEQNFFVPTGRFSFPSGHAATVSAAFAFFYKKLLQNQKMIFATMVLLVMVSRVYLGRHFPLDVIAGLLVGLAAGFAMLHFNKWFYESPARRELGILASLLLFLAVIFLFEKFAVITLPLGYYAGLFLFKEFGLDSTRVFGKRFYFKSFLGLLGLGAMLLFLLLAKAPIAVQAGMFFFAGLWITLIFPWAYEIVALKKKTATK